MSRIAKVGVAALGTGAVVLSGSGLAAADADAKAVAIGSGGFLSGNVIQIPIHAPINVCGNTVTGLGGLNRAVANSCKIDDDKKDHKKDQNKSVKKADRKSDKKARHNHGH